MPQGVNEVSYWITSGYQEKKLASSNISDSVHWKEEYCTTIGYRRKYISSILPWPDYLQPPVSLNFFFNWQLATANQPLAVGVHNYQFQTKSVRLAKEENMDLAAHNLFKKPVIQFTTGSSIFSKELLIPSAMFRFMLLFTTKRMSNVRQKNLWGTENCTTA